jgi:hypothetical protein
LNPNIPTLRERHARLDRGIGESSRLESNVPEASSPTQPDINIIAYERVKNMWIKYQIWDDKWSLLPGMSWKHEQPREDFLRERMGDHFDSIAYLLERDRRLAAEIRERDRELMTRTQPASRSPTSNLHRIREDVLRD